MKSEETSVAVNEDGVAARKWSVDDESEAAPPTPRPPDLGGVSRVLDFLSRVFIKSGRLPPD